MKPRRPSSSSPPPPPSTTSSLFPNPACHQMRSHTSRFGGILREGPGPSWESGVERLQSTKGAVGGRS
eukprot:1864874-Rhodomonas_salina.2